PTTGRPDLKRGSAGTRIRRSDLAAYDFRAQRLFVEEDLAQGESVALGRDPSHYLVNVLRLTEGAQVILFNGRDGEWLASLARAGKRGAVVAPERGVRPQTPAGDLHYLFAPLKHARLDYMVQKAVEMGASTIRPVVTRHTQVSRVTIDRMRANAVEAAEQCGILAVPAIGDESKFDRLMDEWPPDRLMIFCDEGAEIADPLYAFGQAGRGPV